jgi:hypothetical protein
MPDGDLTLWPTWPQLRSDMLLSVAYPSAPLPHYISVGQLSSFISGGGIALPLALGQGGTGATTAAAARDALGAAPLASPVFTGTPQAPTQLASDNGTALATTAWVRGALEAASTQVSAMPPLDPEIGQLWFDAETANLFVWYEDSTSGQWVIAVNPGGVAQGTPTDWANITGKPATFPPTVPIAQSDVTTLTADLAAKAPLASPAFTGTPSLPSGSTGVTQAAATSNTSLATTAYVKSQNYLTGNQTVTLSGDLTGSGTTAISATLATVNANVGTFQGLTVNAKGLVTAAVNQSYLTGTVAIGSGGTGQTTAAAGLTALGGLPLAGGTLSGPLTINQPSNVGLTLNAGAGDSRLILTVTGQPSNWYIAAQNNAYFWLVDNQQGLTRIVVTNTGACQNASGTWATISDPGLKEGVETYRAGLDAVRRLRAVSFRYRQGTPFAPQDAPSERLIGLLADEVEETLPELVGRTMARVDGEDREVATVSPGLLVFALLNAVTELAVRLDAIEEARGTPPDHGT